MLIGIVVVENWLVAFDQQGWNARVGVGVSGCGVGCVVKKTLTHIPQPTHTHNSPNLTTFFVASSSATEDYDDSIVPPVQQMPNMEKLRLYLQIENRSEFIDGADLYNDILIYMPRMIKFTFNIITMNNYFDINYWLKEDGMKGRYIIDDAHPY
ncbi:unnamed protein product [Rotaria sp. Silwood1]|nr:unnamed protein product [Rotaria sp. Silwood1]